MELLIVSFSNRRLFGRIGWNPFDITFIHTSILSLCTYLSFYNIVIYTPLHLTL
jgi:hypothetical protein